MHGDKDKIETERESRLSKLEDRIYSKDNPILFRDNRSIIHQNTENISKDWQVLEDETPKPEREENHQELGFFHSFSRKLFYSAVVISFMVLGYAGYVFYFNANGVNKNKIGLSLETPGYIDGGVTFGVDTYITNGNKTELQNVDLVIEYPKGETLTNQDSMVVKRIPIGTIAPGATAHGQADIVLFGREGNVRNIRATIEYYAPNSSNVLKKEVLKTLTLRSAPLVVSTENLKEIASNGEVALTIHLRAERGLDLTNAILKVEYPQGFTFIKSSIPSFDEKSVWRFDTIPKGTEQVVTIYGRLRGEDGDEKVFHIYSGLEDALSKGVLGILYTENKTSINITKPFISIKSLVKGVPQTSQGDFVIEPGKRTEGVIAITNNVENTVSSIVVNASLSGEILNRNKVIAVGGYYDSANNKLIWNQNTDKRLAQILPGETIELPFVLESYPLSFKQNGYFANPLISISSNVNARRVTDTAVPEVYSAGNPLVIKVITDTKVTGTVTRDTTYFKPFGVYPPESEKETSYSIILNAYNRTNPVTNAKVEFSLPEYVEYRGNFAPENEQITYNPASHIITWTIGDLKEDTGYGRGQRTAALEVVLKPSINLIGQSPALTGEITLTGKDVFTETSLLSKTRELYTTDKVK